MTNIFNGTIDICNQLVLLSTIPTTQQLSGANYLSNIRFKYVNTIYDLAEVYEINSALVGSNPPLNIFTNYNSVKTDIGYIFKKPTSSTNTINSINSTNVSNTTSVRTNGSNYTLFRISSTVVSNRSTIVTCTNTITIDGSTTAYIMVVGPGGYGSGGTSTTWYSGGGGGSVVISSCILSSGTYTVALTSSQINSGGIINTFSSFKKSDDSIIIRAPGGGSALASGGGNVGGSGFSSTGTINTYGLNGGQGGPNTRLTTIKAEDGPQFPNSFTSNITIPSNMTTSIPNGYYGSGGATSNGTNGGQPGSLSGGGTPSSVAMSLSATSATDYGCGGGSFKNANSHGGLGAFGVVYIYIDSSVP